MIQQLICWRNLTVLGGMYVDGANCVLFGGKSLDFA